MMAGGESKSGGREGRGAGHTQLLHAVVDQLLLLFFIGNGLRLQLAGLWTRLRSEIPQSHLDSLGDAARANPGLESCPSASPQL